MKINVIKKGFTLAEIMVVLFIMTIILAAFAPLMTVRAKSTSKTSPWNWATPDSANTYFGVHPNQRVMIGQKSQGTDVANKLTINANDEQSHILFKNSGRVFSMHLNSLNNVFFDTNAQNRITSGYGNYSFGQDALTSTTTGYWNTAMGSAVLTDNTTGADNTAVGHGALWKNTTGNNNSAFGAYSLVNNKTGSGNTAIGTSAFANISAGSYNTAIGYYACNPLTSANYTTCIGSFAGPSPQHTANNTVYIGNPYSTVKILGYLEASSSNISSDIRLKNIQGDYTGGLEQIKKIKPVKFTFKDDKKKTPRVGVIAQDLQKVFPQAVIKGDDGFLKIRQEDMFYAMINAIKELASKLDTIIEKQKSIEKRLKKLENKK